MRKYLRITLTITILWWLLFFVFKLVVDDDSSWGLVVMMTNVPAVCIYCFEWSFPSWFEPEPLVVILFNGFLIGNMAYGLYRLFDWLSVRYLSKYHHRVAIVTTATVVVAAIVDVAIILLF